MQCIQMEKRKGKKKKKKKSLTSKYIHKGKWKEANTKKKLRVRNEKCTLSFRDIASIVEGANEFSTKENKLFSVERYEMFVHKITKEEK